MELTHSCLLTPAIKSGLSHLLTDTSVSTLSKLARAFISECPQGSRCNDVIFQFAALIIQRGATIFKLCSKKQFQHYNTKMMKLCIMNVYMYIEIFVTSSDTNSVH